MDDVKIEGWIPYKLTDVEGEPICQWLNTFNLAFTEPFFDSTITKCMALDANLNKFCSVSNLDAMAKWAGEVAEVPPAAFIFHISRCGSTLVSQLLASSPKNVSLAEVPFFDDILRLPFKYKEFNEAEINGLLKAAITYYSYKITADGKTGEQKKPNVYL